MKIYQINESYRWEVTLYDEYLLAKLYHLKKGWFGIKYWGNCLRGSLIELIENYDGRPCTMQYSFYSINRFDSKTFELKTQLAKWYNDYCAQVKRSELKEMKLLNIINKL